MMHIYHTCYIDCEKSKITTYVGYTLYSSAQIKLSKHIPISPIAYQFELTKFKSSSNNNCMVENSLSSLKINHIDHDAKRKIHKNSNVLNVVEIRATRLKSLSTSNDSKE